MTLLKDAPRRFGAYTPENYDRGFLGPVFARDALALSRNVPAVHLMSRLETAFFPRISRRRRHPRAAPGGLLRSRTGAWRA